MKMDFDLNLDIPERLYELMIGQKVIEFVRGLRIEEIESEADMEAIRALSKIVDILDEDGTDDPECFRRIEEIVDALRDSGILTSRHDW